MVVVFSAPQQRAVAEGQVARKGVERVRSHIREGTAPALQKTSEMDCRAQVSYGTRQRVTVPFKSISKAVDVWTTETRPQARQGLGSTKVLFQHGILLVIWPVMATYS